MQSKTLLPLLCLLILAWTGCDSIDDLSGGARAPEITFTSTTYEADFFETGSSGTPSIDWNGAQGTISLGSSIQGLNVNSTTGQLQWNKMLPPGTHNVEVVVSNSEGQVVVPVTINNPLSGTFEGTYAGSYDFRLEFSEDGSLLVFADGLTATGTFEVDNGELTGYYIYDDYPDIDYTILADVEQTNAAATLTGDYYEGEYSAGDTPVNEFEVTLQ